MRASSASSRLLRGTGLVAALAVIAAGLTALVAPVSASAATALPSVSSVHPRVMATAADFTRLTSQIKSGQSQALYAAIKKEADADLTSPVVTYSKPDGIRLIATSETTLKHVLALGMMYKLTGSQTYVDRLWKDLDAVSKFKDWNPDEYLDTAEMTTAVAIAYDWLYSKWNASQRSELVNAIVTKGLSPSLAVYRAAPTSGGPYKYGGNWSQQNGNWNIVVNSGMAIGALAVYTERPDVAKPVLGYALSSIQKGVATYANGGGWPEGLGYWEYATRYFTMFVQSLETATGSDQGFLKKAGVADTGYVPLYLSSPSGATTFAYGDSAVAPYLSSAVGALGKLLGNRVLATAGDVPNDYGSNVQRLLSVVPSMTPAQPSQASLPLDRAFTNAAATTFRSSWTDPNATFVGFRSGNTPSAAHQNLDAGSFSLGALGETWADELGKDDYNLAGYFDSTSNGARWNYYRERAEGQNTLVIDPSDPDSISTTATVPAATFSSNGANGQSIATLTSLYANDVTGWRRGVKTFDGGTETVVQDEISTTHAVDADWIMHTAADIRISADGRTALLYEDGKELAARITSGPTGAVFTQGQSVPYPTSPALTQSSNAGMNALHIALTTPSGTWMTRLTVEFTPVVDPGSPLPATQAPTALSSWTVGTSAAASTTPVAEAVAPSAGDPLTTATLSSPPTSLALGQTAALSVTGRDASGAQDGAVATRFVTSDPTIATVSATGVVQALKPGSVRVGAILTDGGYTASAGATVSVVDPRAIHVVTDADTYVQGGTTANQNFGKATKLAIKPHRAGQVATTLTRTAYVHFTVPRTAGHRVSSAIVSIPGLVSDANGTKVEVDAHLVTASWGETTLTYAHQPKIGSTIAHATYSGSTLTVQRFDITNYVNSAGFTGSFSLAFTEDAPPHGQPLLAVMTSRESSTPPVLDVELAQ